MKIFSIVTQLETGGAQSVAVDLHEAFIERGHESTLFFAYEKDSSSFPERNYQTGLTFAPRSPQDYGRALRQLFRALKRANPDFILAHTHFSVNMCAIACALGAPGKLIAIHHNIYSSYPSYSRHLDKISRILGRYRSEISVSSAVAESLPHKGGKVIASTIVENGQNVSASKMSRADARESFGLPAGEFIIGNVGRLSHQKNQSFLVDLLPDNKDWHLAILGEGELRGDLIRQAEAAGLMIEFIFSGRLSVSAFPDFLKAIDAFAMPSFFEGMSIAMLESLAAGVPFIGNDIAEISRVVHGNSRLEAGVVLPLEPSAWIQILQKIQTDEGWRSQLCEREKMRAAEFSVGAMAENYLRVMLASTGRA